MTFRSSRAVDAPVVAVLGYHKVGPWPGDWWTWYYVPEDVFARQLDWLTAHRFELIDLARLKRGLSEPETLPERSALITFDDGYKSLRAGAATRLEAVEGPAVVFMATDFVGKTNAFDRDIEPDEQMCDWEDLRELHRSRFSIQSHTASHALLTDLPRDRQRDELASSRQAIEQALGTSVTSVSYPYGGAGPERAFTELVASCGYEAGFGYGGGPLSVHDVDRFRIPRLAIGPDTDLASELPR